MYLCDDGHDEVCHESRQCPVCAVMEKLDAAESENDTLRGEINSLERDNSSLESEVDDLKEEISKLQNSDE